MNEPQRRSVSRLDVEGEQSGKKQRTLKDTLLISAWVAVYAGVLVIFRVAGAVESLLTPKEERAADDRGKTGGKSLLGE